MTFNLWKTLNLTKVKITFLGSKMEFALMKHISILKSGMIRGTLLNLGLTSKMDTTKAFFKKI